MSQRSLLVATVVMVGVSGAPQVKAADTGLIQKH